jgi:hypothetical protein
MKRGQVSFNYCRFVPTILASNFEIFCTNFVFVFHVYNMVCIEKWEITYACDTFSIWGMIEIEFLIALEWY